MSSVIISPGQSKGIPGGYASKNSQEISPRLSFKGTFLFCA